MELVTGYKGASHVTAEQVADFQAGVFGNGNYILNIGSKFRCDINSANKVTINDGVLIMQGRQIVIENNDSEQINVENGTMDMKRHDLIVVKYEKSVDNTESASLDIIKGVTATDPVDPVVPYLNADIRSGADVCQVPLYRIVIDGLAISSTVCLVNVITSIDGSIKKVNNKTPDSDGNVQLSASDIGARSSDWMPPLATTSQNGLLSASDKGKLDTKVVDSSGDGWIRYADGTQICYMQGSFTITSNDTVVGGLISNLFSLNKNFPKSFSSNPALVFTLSNSQLIVGAVTRSTSQIGSLRLFLGVSGQSTATIKSQSVQYYCVAVGRWK